MLTAPIPLILFVFLFYRWYQDKTDLTRLTSRFIQRQGQVIAHDAMKLSKDMSDLLVTTANDIRSLSLIPSSQARYAEFLAAHQFPVTWRESKRRTLTQLSIPLYRYVARLSVQGNETLRYEAGATQQKLRALKDCRESDLCDRRAREQAINLTPGKLLYGNLMRWYTPKGTEDNGEGTYTVLYRGPNVIFELGLDYRHIRSLLYIPTFPYEARDDLMRAYESGNYAYVLDTSTDMLAHPRNWHVTGIDRATGAVVLPVVTDKDIGTHRMNVRAYRGDKIKVYFNRLLSRSLVHRSVDMFRSPNLMRKNLVLAVAPIVLNLGQFEKAGIFGHVVLGCSTEYFEEPREPFIPYY